MQVSWIDSNHINSLLAQITPQEAPAEPQPKPAALATADTSLISEAWDISTGWIDAGVEESRLQAAAAVELAMVPIESAPQQEMPSTNTEEDEESFELPHAASALPLNRIRDKLRAIRQRAMEAGILVRANEIAPSPVVEEIQTTDVSNDDNSVSEPQAPSVTAISVSELPVFEIPQGSREERLAAFALWTRRVLHEHGGHVLVMNDDGEVLWGGDAKAGLLLSTMMAWSAAIRGNAVSACGKAAVIHQPLASGNVLTVIPCETSGGIFHAAVAAPTGLSDELALALCGALCAAMS